MSWQAFGCPTCEFCKFMGLTVVEIMQLKTLIGIFFTNPRYTVHAFTLLNYISLLYSPVYCICEIRIYFSLEYDTHTVVFFCHHWPFFLLKALKNSIQMHQKRNQKKVWLHSLDVMLLKIRTVDCCTLEVWLQSLYN